MRTQDDSWNPILQGIRHFGKSPLNPPGRSIDFVIFPQPLKAMGSPPEQADGFFGGSFQGRSRKVPEGVWLGILGRFLRPQSGSQRRTPWSTDPVPLPCGSLFSISVYNTCSLGIAKHGDVNCKTSPIGRISEISGIPLRSFPAALW